MKNSVNNLTIFGTASVLFALLSIPVFASQGGGNSGGGDQNIFKVGEVVQCSVVGIANNKLVKCELEEGCSVETIQVQCLFGY